MSKLQIIHSHRFSNRHAKQSAQHRRLRAKFAHDLYRNSIRYFYHGGKLMTNNGKFYIFWQMLAWQQVRRLLT